MIKIYLSQYIRYIANTAILKLKFQEKIANHFRLMFLLPPVDDFTVDIEEEYFPSCSKSNDAKSSHHNCSTILRFAVANHIYWLI